MSTLFIGLGGVGCGTLEVLSNRMNDYNRHLLANKRPQVVAEYVYIDTEDTMQRKNPQAFVPSKTHKTWLSLAEKSPDQIKTGLSNVGDDSWKKWYDAGNNEYALTMGADAKRQFSRLAFKEKSDKIRTELNNLMINVKDTNGRVYVITGSCGGTGCGIYMDVLYMIAEIYSDLNTNEESTDVRLIMAMPEGYLDKDDPKLNVKKHQGLLNAFATLTELDAMCKKRDTLLFNNCFVGTNKKTDGTFRPFHFGYMYDSAGLSRDEVCQRVSDYLFELELAGNNTNTVAQGGAFNGSEFDLQMTNEVNAVWGRTIGNKYVNAFCSLGQYSIEKPDDLYRQYFADHLLFDVINEGLIGSMEKVDENAVSELEQELTNAVSDIVDGWVNGISDMVTKNDFSDDGKFHEAFAVFTPYRNLAKPFVSNVIAQKNSCLKEIENMVYTHCRDWLKKYDFATVYKVLDATDVYYYDNVEIGYMDLSQKVANAKQDSYGGIRGKTLKSEKAEKLFKGLLKTWLTIEAKKALSSGPQEDIKEKDKGYLDACKDFINLVKNSFDIQGIEGWETDFKKRVKDLKAKSDRCYIPELNTITDENNEIIETSEMVITYKNYIRPATGANLAMGTCTPSMLHEKVVNVLEKDSQLSKKMKIDELFSPDILDTSKSLRQRGKSKAFFDAYKKALKDEIDELLRINGRVRELFEKDIVTRLKEDCDENERAKICLDYDHYKETQLGTISISEGGNQVYTFSYSNFQGDDEIMKQLGILDVNGDTPACSANADDEFFSDKIVKLIVKTGYNIGHYRHYEDSYKHYAKENMTADEAHDPFIDKRFKGELDRDGKYSCNVVEALEKIDKEGRAAETAQSFSIIKGYNDVDIYRFCLYLLNEYFSQLKKQSKIDSKLLLGIEKSGDQITIKDIIYKKTIRSYALGDSHVFDLSAVNLNDIVNLNEWIDYIEKQKSQIVDEMSLYVESSKYFDGKIDEKLNDKIGDMMGDEFAKKPVYDFFLAYKDWYDNIVG